MGDLGYLGSYRWESFDGFVQSSSTTCVLTLVGPVPIKVTNWVPTYSDDTGYSSTEVVQWYTVESYIVPYNKSEVFIKTTETYYNYEWVDDYLPQGLGPLQFAYHSLRRPGNFSLVADPQINGDTVFHYCYHTGFSRTTADSKEPTSFKKEWDTVYLIAGQKSAVVSRSPDRFEEAVIGEPARCPTNYHFTRYIGKTAERKFSNIRKRYRNCQPTSTRLICSLQPRGCIGSDQHSP